MRILALIKKDVFLVKKYLLVIFAICVAFPIFINYNATSLMGLTAFLITAIFAVYMALQSVALAETKYPKAEALLCASPYTRKYLVVARYLFFMCIFVITTAIYELVVAFLPDTAMLSLIDIALTLLIGSVLLGIYLPLQYKIGYEKMKYVLMIVILLTPFLLPYLIEWLATSKLDLTFLNSIPTALRISLYTATAVGISVVSSVVSIRIYEAKEF